MSKEPFTGLNTINNILNLLSFFTFKKIQYQIPVDVPYVKEYTRLIVAREMNMLFRRLRQEDQLISAEDLHNLPEPDLDRICFDRGINID